MLRQCEGSVVKVCQFFTYRHKEDFRDLYQEIVCTLWESWPRFRNESSLNTWVFQIAFNVAGQRVRRKRRRPEFVQYDEKYYSALAEESEDPRYQKLYRLIDQLENEEDRNLLFLYLDRHRKHEIATLTNSTENAVKQRLYRIRKTLQKLKQENDG